MNRTYCICILVQEFNPEHLIKQLQIFEAVMAQGQKRATVNATDVRSIPIQGNDIFNNLFFSTTHTALRIR